MERHAPQDTGTGSSGPRASRSLIEPPETEVASSPSARPTSLSIVPPQEHEVAGTIRYHTPRYADLPAGRRESLVLDEEQGTIPIGPPVRAESGPSAGTPSKSAAQSLSATKIPSPSHRMAAFQTPKNRKVAPDGGTVMTVPGVDLSMPVLDLSKTPNRPVSEAASPPNQPLGIEDAPMARQNAGDDTPRVRRKPMSYRGMFYAIVALSVGVVIIGLSAVIIGLSAGLAKNKRLLEAAQNLQGGSELPSDFMGTYVQVMEDYFENVEAIHRHHLCDLESTDVPDKKKCFLLNLAMDHNQDDYETGSTVIVSGKRDPKDPRQKTLNVDKVTKVKGPKDKSPNGGMRRAMQAVSQTRTAVVLIVNWIGSPSIDKALLTWQTWQALLGPSNSVKDMLNYCTWDQYRFDFDVITKPGDYANDTTLDFYWVDVPTKCSSSTFPCPGVYDADSCTIVNGVKTGTYDGKYETVQYAMNVLNLNRSTWQHVIMVHPRRDCWSAGGMGTLGCNGEYCTTWVQNGTISSPHVHLHELGHNFGLKHAGIVGDEYGDRTAVMGSLYPGSAPCFHAPHAVQLGIITPIVLSATNFCPGANYVLDIQSMSETPINSAIQITPDWTSDMFSYFVQFKTATKYDSTITSTHTDFSPTLAPLGIKQHNVSSVSIHMTKLAEGTAWAGIAADPTLSVTLQTSTLAPNLAATVAPYGTSVAKVKVVRGSCDMGYYGNTYNSASIPTTCQGASPAPCLPNQCLWGTTPATTGVYGVICPQNTPGVSQSISCMLGFQFNPSATSISEVCKDLSPSRTVSVSSSLSPSRSVSASSSLSPSRSVSASSSLSPSRSVCPICPTCDASCSDGAKSQGELGVDCGGTTCTKACDATGYQTVTEPDYYTCVDVTGSALTMHNTRWTYIEMLYGYPAYQRSQPECPNGICHMNVPAGSYYKMTRGINDTRAYCGWTTIAGARNSARPLDVTKHTSWQYPNSTCKWNQDTGVTIRPCQCSNGIKDSFEQGVDCGGPCAPCTTSCSDAKRTGLETDVDCGGGTCTACGEGKGCLATSDCTAGMTCNSCGMCVGPGSSYQLFSNTYLNAGGDLAIESMTSLADAGARCNSLSGCLGFTFVVGAWPTNVWFKNHTIRGTSPEWTTYIKKFASSSLSPSRSPAATGRRRQA